MSGTEVRICKAVNVLQDEISFYEESAAPLSDRDRFLEMIDNPPKANAALKKAARMLKRHGRLAD